MAGSTPLLPMTGKQAEPGPAESTDQKKSKKKLFLIVGVVLLLLGGGGAYEIVLKPAPAVALGKDGKPIKAPAAKPTGGDTIQLDPVTTSIADGHVIQIALGLQLVKGGDAKAITAQAPQANDAALQVLAAYTYKVLLSPAGRAKVHQQIKAAVIHRIVTDKGKAEIFDVLLPTYVLQ